MSSFACPSCKGSTEVRDSRPREDGGIRRRRVCTVCKGRFSTWEVPSTDVVRLMQDGDLMSPAVMAQLEELGRILPRLDRLDRLFLLAAARRLTGVPVTTHIYEALGSADHLEAAE